MEAPRIEFFSKALVPAFGGGAYIGLNYKVGMSEMTLRVDKCDRCSGCAFENYIYDCVKSGCLGCEREDGESVRYTIVNT